MCSTVARGRIFSLSREITAVGWLDPCPVLIILTSVFLSVKWECWYFQSYLEDYMKWQEPCMWKRWKKCSFHVPYCTSSLLIFLSSHPLLFQNPVLCGTLNSVKPRLPNHTRTSLPHSLPCGATWSSLAPLSCGDFCNSWVLPRPEPTCPVHLGSPSPKRRQWRGELKALQL